MRNKNIVFLIVFAGLITRLYFAWQPPTLLLSKQLSDDAFYYFKVASNFALNARASFDDINVTNGFHPLWMLVVSIVYRIFQGSGSLPINVALSISSIIDALTIYLVYKIVVSLTSNHTGGLFASILYCFNPHAIFYSTNGIETSFSAFFLALLFYLYLKLRDSSSLKSYAAFGLVGGLLFLSRTDYAIFFVVFSVHLIYSNHSRLALKRLFVSALIAFLIALPWLIWNYHTFGNIIQVSSSAYPFIRRQKLLDAGMDSQGLVFHALKHTIDILLWITYTIPVFKMTEFLFLLLLVFFTIRHSKKHEPNPIVSQFKPLFCVFAGYTVLALVHGGIRLHFRYWYFVQLAFIEAVVIGVLVSYWFKRISDSAKNILFVVLSSGCIILYLSATMNVFDYGLYPWQVEMLEAGLWIRENTPQHTTIGSFNSGIIGYYAGRRVVNLDGEVNNLAYEAITKKQLWQYMKTENITYLVDYDHTLLNEYRKYYGIAVEDKLWLEKRIDLPNVSWRNSTIGVYKIVD